MAALIKSQVNFNSLLSVCLAALVGLAIKKLDENNTILIQVRTTQLNVLERVSALEAKESRQDDRISRVETSVEILSDRIKKPL